MVAMPLPPPPPPPPPVSPTVCYCKDCIYWDEWNDQYKKWTFEEGDWRYDSGDCCIGRPTSSGDNAFPHTHKGEFCGEGVRRDCEKG